MPISEVERRQLREVEAELADQRGLAKLARRLGEASVDKGMGRTILLWGVGGSLGLILVVVGAVVHSNAVVAAGVVSLIVTLLVVGAALIAVQVHGDLREHRLGSGSAPAVALTLTRLTRSAGPVTEPHRAGMARARSGQAPRLAAADIFALNPGR